MKKVPKSFLAKVAAKRREILAMGHDRKKALEKLSALEDTITLHLYKVLAMPSSRDKAHWIGEIEGYRLSLSRKNNSRAGKPNFNESLLKRILWLDGLSMIEDRRIIVTSLEQEGYQIEKRPGPLTVERYVDKFISCVLQNRPFRG